MCFKVSDAEVVDGKLRACSCILPKQTLNVGMPETPAKIFSRLAQIWTDCEHMENSLWSFPTWTLVVLNDEPPGGAIFDAMPVQISSETDETTSALQQHCALSSCEAFVIRGQLGAPIVGQRNRYATSGVAVLYCLGATDVFIGCPPIIAVATDIKVSKHGGNRVGMRGSILSSALFCRLHETSVSADCLY